MSKHRLLNPVKWNPKKISIQHDMSLPSIWPCIGHNVIINAIFYKYNLSAYITICLVLHDWLAFLENYIIIFLCHKKGLLPNISIVGMKKKKHTKIIFKKTKTKTKQTPTYVRRKLKFCIYVSREFCLQKTHHWSSNSKELKRPKRVRNWRALRSKIPKHSWVNLLLNRPLVFLPFIACYSVWGRAPCWKPYVGLQWFTIMTGDLDEYSCHWNSYRIFFAYLKQKKMAWVKQYKHLRFL